MRTIGIVAFATGAALAAVAYGAGPQPKALAARGEPAPHRISGGGGSQWHPPTRGAVVDNFEGYAVGSSLVNPANGGPQGGWAWWDDSFGSIPAGDGIISNRFPQGGGTKALMDVPASDITHPITSATSGQWTLRALTYLPTTAADGSPLVNTQGYVIGLNTYVPDPNTGGAYDWSVEGLFWYRAPGTNSPTDPGRMLVHSDAVSFTVSAAGSPPNYGETTLITDQWVEYKVLIDFDRDLMVEFYNGQEFGRSAFNDGSCPRINALHNLASPPSHRLQVLDLYENVVGTAPGEFYYDDVRITPGACFADINGVNGVNVADFLAFLQLYAAGDARADFNNDCGVNVQDFLAFLQAYSAGCS
jgi:hypothetical protein